MFEPIGFLVARTATYLDSLYFMGLAIVAEHLKTIARVEVLSSPLQDLKLYHESVAFLHGSGLELVIQDYGLDIDAEHLRDAFETWERQKQTPIPAQRVSA